MCMHSMDSRMFMCFPGFEFASSRLQTACTTLGPTALKSFFFFLFSELISAFTPLPHLLSNLTQDDIDFPIT